MPCVFFCKDLIVKRDYTNMVRQDQQKRLTSLRLTGLCGVVNVMTAALFSEKCDELHS